VRTVARWGSEPGQIREEAALRIPHRCRGFISTSAKGPEARGSGRSAASTRSSRRRRSRRTGSSPRRPSRRRGRVRSAPPRDSRRVCRSRFRRDSSRSRCWPWTDSSVRKTGGGGRAYSLSCGHSYIHASCSWHSRRCRSSSPPAARAAAGTKRPRRARRRSRARPRRSRRSRAPSSRRAARLPRGGAAGGAVRLSRSLARVLLFTGVASTVVAGLVTKG